eukprot:6041503-Amphidinium_carterae.1
MQRPQASSTNLDPSKLASSLAGGVWKPLQGAFHAATTCSLQDIGLSSIRSLQVTVEAMEFILTCGTLSLHLLDMLNSRNT